MAITIDWGNKIISVPKADLELVQETPTEILKLDLNWFRLILKDLEDSETGMPFPDTHRHNEPVEVGEVTLARVFEIINDYTVTFEDGQYAVNLYGANSNLADRVNVNQVSVRSSNSAGLVSSAAIEYGEYGGGVTVDIDNGESGTIYPIGTNRRPVNNISDAVTIADGRGFIRFFIKSDLTLTTGDDLDSMILIGEDMLKTTITIEDGASVSNTIFQRCSITGILDGNNQLDDCMVDDLTYFYGIILRCSLNGTITLDGDAQANIINCWSNITGLTPPIVNCGGSGQSLSLRNYNGGIRLQNKTGTDTADLDINAGFVIIDDTVTTGVVSIRGIGNIINNSANEDIDSTGLISNDSIWDELLAGHTTSGSAGAKLNTASSGGVDYETLATTVHEELQTEFNDINTNIDGLTFTISNDDVERIVEAIYNQMSPSLKIIKGLVQHNFNFCDQVYSTSGNLLSGTIKLYYNSADVDSGENLMASYDISAEYNTSGNLTNYKVKSNE